MTALDLDAIRKRHAKDIRGQTAGPNGFADGTWEGQLLNDSDDLLAEIDRLTRQLAEARAKIREPLTDEGWMLACLAAREEREMARAKAIEECAEEIPTNWCDQLLSGPDAVLTEYRAREIEHLLRAIQDRIRSLARHPQR